jgi:hypothetical protein
MRQYMVGTPTQKFTFSRAIVSSVAFASNLAATQRDFRQRYSRSSGQSGRSYEKAAM